MADVGVLKSACDLIDERLVDAGFNAADLQLGVHEGDFALDDLRNDAQHELADRVDTREVWLPHRCADYAGLDRHQRSCGHARCLRDGRACGSLLMCRRRRRAGGRLASSASFRQPGDAVLVVEGEIEHALQRVAVTDVGFPDVVFQLSLDRAVAHPIRAADLADVHVAGASVLDGDRNLVDELPHPRDRRQSEIAGGMAGRRVQLVLGFRRLGTHSAAERHAQPQRKKQPHARLPANHSAQLSER
mmetsp:Transcript_53758/g.126760  ORF Transcript_53758/g.126760 Transcript_53758/m.126760 type:complete len:246 (+) Transcript_53758:521-1258(+)